LLGAKASCANHDAATDAIPTQIYKPDPSRFEEVDGLEDSVVVSKLNSRLELNWTGQVVRCLVQGTSTATAVMLSVTGHAFSFPDAS
jgi:hypothetical protein